jgi:hypothetical protein
MEANLLATAAHEKERPTGERGREEGEVPPQRSRPRGWPTGLIGALGLILLLEPIIARIPGGDEGRSRLAVSWQSSLRTATEPEARADILCFGDSLIKLGILPRVLEVRLGRSAFNLAVLGGQPPTSYFLLRRVLEAGNAPRALVVNFSPLLLGMDPRVSLEWWAGLLQARERLELAGRARDPGLAGSLILNGFMASLAHRDAFRVELGFAPFEGEERLTAEDLKALLRNWDLNRGAQVAPRPFVPIRGSLPRPHDRPGWRWQPHPAHAYFVERFLTLAQARRIPVYWIIPPAEAEWLDRNESVGTVSAYRRYVHGQLSRFHVLTVLDMQRAGWDRRWFRDPIHVNRDGAIRLSLAVAETIARTRDAQDRGGCWIEMDGVGSVPAQAFQDLLEDLDESRLAVNQGESGPITMEGPR